MEELTWWAVLTKGAVRKALGALGAEALAVPAWAKEAWLLPARSAGVAIVRRAE